MFKRGFPPISTALALRFLMARKFDHERASRLFQNHLKLRHEYNMALIQPLDEPLSMELLSGKLTVLARPEEDEPSIVLVSNKQYFPSKQDNEIIIQSMIFQLDEALRDTTAQRNGLVIIYNMVNSRRENFNYKFGLKLLHLFVDSYPARLKKIFIISAPVWFKISFKVTSAFLKEKIRDRVQFTDEQNIREHLRPECIPMDLGGSWDVDHVSWMSRCMSSYKDGNYDEPCFQMTGELNINDDIKEKQQSYNERHTRHCEQSSKTGKPPPKERLPNTMMVSELLAHMREKGPTGLKEEFESLPKYDSKASFDVFKLPHNRNKNRYIDVICLDNSRVQIPPVDGDMTTDYIHANYVDGFHGKNSYIAAQGPMPQTFNDFWQMIWLTGTEVIIMLTKEIQRGRVKCGRYWPELGAFKQYRHIEVSCLEEIGRDHFVTRKLLVNNSTTGESRTVNHFQMITWPDFGVPDSAEPIFQLKSSVDDLHSAGLTKRAPIVVHCSAGIGRTGSYITISTGIDSLINTSMCNVQDTVKNMRAQRALSVQTADQYELCYTALLEFAALHVTSIDPREKIDILEFLNDWKQSNESNNFQ